MNKASKIYVAGHKGLVGSAIVRYLQNDGFRNLIFKTKDELDLTNDLQTQSFFEREKPEYVFLAAARVGGIVANNNYPADFIYTNLKIQNNVLHNAYISGVTKLLFLGSTCIYPKLAPQPLKEEYLLTGPLEETNYAYAVAKIAGIKMCKAYNTQYGTNFISAMPTNLYGINDNFDLETSHVLPALIRKLHEAKINNTDVTLWGTGKPRREFLYVDDLADALIFLMENYNESDIINVGTGTDLTIKELAETIAGVVGFTGKMIFDITKPDGTPQKLVDTTKINQLGWSAKTTMSEGLSHTYTWYKEQYHAQRF